MSDDTGWGLTPEPAAGSCFICGATEDLALGENGGLVCADEAVCAARVSGWRPTGVVNLDDWRDRGR